jgi:hypothetical protein
MPCKYIGSDNKQANHKVYWSWVLVSLLKEAGAGFIVTMSVQFNHCPTKPIKIGLQK